MTDAYFIGHQLTIQGMASAIIPQKPQGGYMLLLASGQAVVVTDDMRKIRIAGDVELSRRWPGWFCVMFHQGEFVEGSWLLTYSVQMTEQAEPRICRILIERVRMADGSAVWGASLVRVQ